MKKDEMTRTEVGDDVLRTPGDEESRPPKTSKEARRKSLQDQIQNRRRIRVGETEGEAETVFSQQDQRDQKNQKSQKPKGKTEGPDEAEEPENAEGAEAEEAEKPQEPQEPASPAPPEASGSPRLPFWAELLQRTFDGDTDRLEALAEVPEHYLDVVDEDPIPVTWVMDGQEIPSSYDIIEYYPRTDDQWWDRMVLRYRPERNAFAPEGGQELQLRINNEETYNVVPEYISNQCAGGTPDVFGYETVFVIVKGGEEDGEQESSGQRGTGFIS